MVSVVMLLHRSSRGKDGFGLESKESKKGPIESMQIELKSKTLTLGEKSGGAYQGLTTVSNAEALHRAGSPAQQREWTAARRDPVAGARAASGATARPLDGGALARGRVRTSANGPAAAPPPFPASRAVIASTQWLPPLVERGKGEGENDPRFWGAATAMRVLIWRKPRTTVRS